MLITHVFTVSTLLLPNGPFAGLFGPETGKRADFLSLPRCLKPAPPLTCALHYPQLARGSRETSRRL